jgi:RNA polymerase sigma factor (TIGR02999 family)
MSTPPGRTCIQLRPRGWTPYVFLRREAAVALLKTVELCATVSRGRTMQPSQMPSRDGSADLRAEPDNERGGARGEVTRLLGLARHGDRDAVDRLFPLVYAELRGLARSQVRRGSGATLNATGLVHEAYLKLAGPAPVRAESRAHFLAIAGRAMRQVLVDRARMQQAKKRGGGAMPITLLDGDAVLEIDPVRMLALNQAIEGLDSRQRQVVEARFFAGLEETEIAELLGVSERTVRREWVKARAWLVRALGPDSTAVGTFGATEARAAPAVPGVDTADAP